MLFRLAIARVTDSSRKTRIVSASAAVLTLIAFGAAGVSPNATDSDDVQVCAISAELQLPSLNEQIAKLEAQQQLYIAEDKIRDGDKFSVSQENPSIERRVAMHTGVIRSSLFASTDAADIPDSVASQIVAMFGTDINLASDLKRGDHFNVAYETFWQNGQFLRAGRILAGEFVNVGKPFQAVWFDDPSNAQGRGYYGFDGKSLKKAFLKSPLAFTRISSGFSIRMHPILGKWKKHTYVDFAASGGTPIHATADGTIDFAGVETGYGNVVIIKHDSKYSTVYAYMSRFAPTSRKDAKVSQSDVIGYVGMTGWTTGTHLHYEFLVGNQPRDPLSVVVPTVTPLADPELQRFRSVAADITHRFNLLNGSEVAAVTPTRIASK